VIGINTAIVSGANGIGFAIPADRARRVVQDLLRFGELRPLWTGLRLMTVDPELARRNDLATTHGALVDRVYPDSPAARAGFAKGDVIVAVQGRPVAAREDVTTALYSLPEGTPIALRVERGGRGSRPVELRLAPAAPPRGLGLQILEQRVGLAVEERGGGLEISRVAGGSSAARTGLESGDAILQANGRDVTTTAALGEEVLRGFDRGSLLLVVQRGRFAYNLEFQLD
jgi:serine protease Do